MMMIMKKVGEPEYDQLQESFSFTSFDLRSSISLFSDYDDEETYIEIALEQPQEENTTTAAAAVTSCPAGDVELRASFDQSCNRVSFKNKISTPSSSPPRSMAAKDKPKGQFLGLDRLLNVFMSALTGPSLKNQEDKGLADDNSSNGQLSVNSGSWKVVKSSRKVPKVSTTTNSRVMKFFIKFQSINLRSMVTPISKNHQGSTSRKSKMYLTNGERSSRALGLNLDSIKGVMETITRAKRGSTQKTESYRGSAKSSPTQDGTSGEKKSYTRENSVQGAIAHCKRSFTQDGG